MPKSLTDIIPPSRRRAMEGGTTPPPSYTPPQMSGGREKKRFPMKWVIAAVVVVVASIGVLFAFGGAKVEATPTMRTATVSGEFSATPSAGELPFQVVSVEKIGSKEVKAEGTETANVPAQGTITIYNAQDKVQELINNTRFETPEGLIFRIRESVKVPAGSTATPGELKVTVYADAGGNSYNIGPSTFAVPGLRGSATYDLVYGRSTEPMTGGFTGERPSLPEAARQSQYQSMQTGLEADLRADISAQVPEGYVLLPGALFFSYVPQPDAAGKSDAVNLQLAGTASAYVMPKEALARAIAFRSLGVYGGQPVTLYNWDNLTLTPTGVPAGTDTFAFTLGGEAAIAWIVDPAEIAGAIAGKSRDAARTILAGFSELEEARLVLRPFWATTMPADPADIQVEVLAPKQGEN